jgi:hypothetical protein
MHRLITSKHKHLLFKDEINHTFLLTKSMEIYRKSDTILLCCCWSFKTYIQLRSKGIIFNDWSTDDGLYLFETNKDNLDSLIQCGTQKRRIHKNGKWLKSRERKLAHRIFPFNPSF